MWHACCEIIFCSCWVRSWMDCDCIGTRVGASPEGEWGSRLFFSSNFCYLLFTSHLGNKYIRIIYARSSSLPPPLNYKKVQKNHCTRGVYNVEAGEREIGKILIRLCAWISLSRKHAIASNFLYAHSSTRPTSNNQQLCNTNTIMRCFVTVSIGATVLIRFGADRMITICTAALHYCVCFRGKRSTIIIGC
jgi:hypothetical protein